MPESAIATGLADYVLPVEQMPEALVKYVQHFHVNGGRVVAAVDETPDHLNQLLALLRARTKFDFRCYRKKMLARRLERRMGLSHFENVAEYLAHLREHPEEVKQLARDLLISVTRFFRDPDAFSTLETEVIAPLIQAKDADAPLRVWVPGCATGEEAYSIAMLLLEHQTAAQNPCRLQIFATDVDEQALEVARRGIYPEGISADVSPERLAHLFALKVPQVITHEKCLDDCAAEMTGFLTAAEHLGDKLGPLLLQFPYFNRTKFKTGAEFQARLSPFLEKLPQDFQFAVEIRNKNWLDENFTALLRERQVALAVIDQAWMPTIQELTKKLDPVTSNFTYVRWLGDRKGIEQQTKSWDKTILDRRSALSHWVDYCYTTTHRGKKVFAYANNHYAGHAPATVALFLELWNRKNKS